MTQHSKFRQYHMKAMKYVSATTGALFLSGVFFAGCDSERIEKIGKNPLHRPYTLQEEIYKDLESKRNEFNSVCYDKEKREDFSKLVNLASNNFVKSELSRPRELKEAYDREIKNGSIEGDLGALVGYSLIAGICSTIVLATTYPLTMAGDAIYRRRKRKE